MDLREVVHRAWRWPLYSRTRAITVLTAVVVIVAVAPQIGGSTPPPAAAAAPSTSSTTQIDQATDIDADPVSARPTTAGGQPSAAAATAATPSSITHDTAPATRGLDPAGPAPARTTPHSAALPATGSSTAPASSDAFAQVQVGDIPGPPPLQPAQADFATPEAAASRWLQVWCWIPATGAANANMFRAAAWMTTAGRDDDQTRRVTAQSWDRTKNAGLSTACGPATAQQPISAPQQPTVRWVEVTAQQTVYDTTDHVIDRRQISQTRKVVKNAAGRWLVDVEVQAG